MLALEESKFDLMEKLQEDLKEMRHVKGGEYVLFLMRYNYKEIPYFYLEHCCKDGGELFLDNYFDFMIIDGSVKYFIDSSIMMCDEQTRDEILKRLEAVKEKINLAEEMNMVNELVNLYKEKQGLVKYVCEVLTPFGGIRNFKHTVMKPRKAVIASINRFFDEYEQIDEELAKDLKKRMMASKWTVKMNWEFGIRNFAH